MTDGCQFNSADVLSDCSKLPVFMMSVTFLFSRKKIMFAPPRPKRFQTKNCTAAESQACKFANLKTGERWRHQKCDMHYMRRQQIPRMEKSNVHRTFASYHDGSRKRSPNVRPCIHWCSPFLQQNLKALFRSTFLREEEIWAISFCSNCDRKVSQHQPRKSHVCGWMPS